MVWDGKDPKKYADSFKVKPDAGLTEEHTMVSAVFHSPLDAARQPAADSADRRPQPDPVAAASLRSARAATRREAARRSRAQPSTGAPSG